MAGETESTRKKKGFRLFGRSKKKSTSKTAAGTSTSGSTKPKSAAGKKSPSDSSTLMTKDPPMPKYYEHNPNKPMLGLVEQSSEASSKTKSTVATSPEQAPPKTIQKKDDAADAKKKKTKEEDDKKPKTSWLCRTSFFRNMCQSAFELIDADGSGEVDEKELYSGLLLIHLKLGTYAGPSACRPLSRERCHIVFHKFDKDNSGHLDREEFDNVMTVLFSNVLFRVMLQYSMTLMIVPFLAQMILTGFTNAIHSVWNLITQLDEHSTYANQVELAIEGARDKVLEVYSEHAPEFFQNAVTKVADVIDSIPDSVWSTVPLTLTSAILGIMIVPWSILKMDDFFQYLADKKAKAVEDKPSAKVAPAKKPAAKGAEI